tara:strand:- start:1473 stop:1778 length:306 start_codon:yes stop_codon:yes gene_type:complete
MLDFLIRFLESVIEMVKDYAKPFVFFFFMFGIALGAAYIMERQKIEAIWMYYIALGTVLSIVTIIIAEEMERRLRQQTPVEVNSGFGYENRPSYGKKLSRK